MSESTEAILQTVIIQTSQMTEMADFYGHGLELGEPSETGGDHLGFPLPNLYFGFDLVDAAPQPSGVVSIWFEVGDIEATFNRFEELGARVKYPPSKNHGERFGRAVRFGWQCVWSFPARNKSRMIPASYQMPSIE